jgi:3-dehydroquinate dehydratase II
MAAPSGRRARMAVAGGATTAAAARDPVLFINGPNANLYGHTGHDLYGAETFEALGRRCQRAAANVGIALDFRQSNSEGGVVDAIQQAITGARGVIINGAGLTYTSIAVLDALQAFPGPIVEVHMSNIYKREPFRHFSFISRAATGIVAGLGAEGYELAVHAMRRLLDRPAAAAPAAAARVTAAPAATSAATPAPRRRRRA